MHGKPISSYSFIGLTTKSKFTLECHNTPIRLAEEMTVDLLWIPGHKGIGAIGMDDDLASLGEGPLTSEGTFRRTNQGTLGLCGKENNNEAWMKSTMCRQVKALIGE